MLKNKYRILAAFLFFFSNSGIWAYDDVKLEKVLPIVDKQSDPRSLHTDLEKRLWFINDAKQSIEQMGQDGKPTVVLMPGKKPSETFKSPADFGFLSDGSMVVADSGFSRMAVLSPESKSNPAALKDWKKVKIINQFPVKSPLAVAVSQDDVIAVASDGQSSIEVYSNDGILLHRLFPSDKFPLKNINAMAYAANGVLWVLDGGVGVLHRFSPDRKWMGAIEGFEDAHAVTVDEFGYAYVCLSPGRWQEVGVDGVKMGIFGTKGKKPGEMLNPLGIAIINGSHVWVADSGNARLQEFQVTTKEKVKTLFPEPAAYVQVGLVSKWEDQVDGGLIGENGDVLLLNADKGKFEWVDPQGTQKNTWKKKGKGSAGFVHPQAMTKGAEGKIWVSDEGDHSLKMMSETGEIEKTVGQKGKKEGGLKSPGYLDLRADGSFVVADKGNSRVQVLSPNGLFLFQVGSSGSKEGQFSSLAGLASNDEFIALLDAGKKSLMFFSSSGKFMFEVANKEGKTAYWMTPCSLAVDPDGRFMVLDKEAGRIRVFNKKGQFLTDVSAKGNFLTAGPNHKVMVIDEKFVSLYSIHFVPRTLANVSAKEVEGDLQITWDNSFEAKDYAIYRSSGGPFLKLTQVEHPPFSDRDTTPGVSYVYAVVGQNDNGNKGNWSLTQPVKAPKRKDVSLLSIEKTDLRPVFTAASKYYVSNPIGEITIRNNDEKLFRNVKLALGLKKYADFPTEVVVPELAAGESKVIPVTMTFNEKVFELTEDTPVQLEVQLSYFEDNNEKSISQNVPITLYSRNAISWTDKGRIASFVTPKDPPVVEFARAAIRDQMALLKGSTVGKPLAKAALFYESLNALGISYVPDPKTPFNQASIKAGLLDYVQFPRETLRRKTGDCDDTTALFSALLQSVGVSAAVIDIPGHVLVMADTEETDISVLGLPEERFIKFQGTYWVPIETTRLGQSFTEAWQSGSARVAAEKDKEMIQFVRISDAAEKYPPVTLVEIDKETPDYPSEKVGKTFPPILKQMENERFEGKLNEIKASIKAEPTNRLLQVELGLVYVEGKKNEEGNKIFVSLLKEDEPVEVQSSARNNLGNLAYLEGNYKEAAIHYEKAAALTPNDGGIVINRGRTAWRLGEKEAAMKYLESAKAVMPEWREFASDIPAEYLPK